MKRYLFLGPALLLLAAGAALIGAWLLNHAHSLPIAPAPFADTISNTAPHPALNPAGMVWIPGGQFTMGSIDPTRCTCSGGSGHESMQDARPLHRVYVDGFFMDATEVTNQQFSTFVQATGYVTLAEQKPDPADFPGVPSKDLVPGSTVFTPPDHPVPLDNYSAWWRYQPGADWRHPQGSGSTIAGKENIPVVQVAWPDAAAYAKWSGKRLPTEAEWEFAARGGQAGKLYAWGDDFRPAGKYMANTFQGEFPNHDAGDDGFAGIAPVAQFPANAYGLFDMAGNVWEWCSDWYDPAYYSQLADAGRVARNPQGPDAPPHVGEKEKVQKGGSFLCTDQYCTRYMVGTRGKGEISTAASHVGFRCVRAP